MPEPLPVLVDRTLAGYGALAEVGAVLEDEWQYVTDLQAVWAGRLQAVGAARNGETVDGHVTDAVDGALAEIGRISDPHRAIDWLSTFPQIVLLALGEEDRPPSASGG